MKPVLLLISTILGLALIAYCIDSAFKGSEKVKEDIRPIEDLDCIRHAYKHRGRLWNLILCKENGQYIYWDEGTPGDSLRQAWLREMMLELD